MALEIGYKYYIIELHFFKLKKKRKITDFQCARTVRTPFGRGSYSSSYGGSRGIRTPVGLHPNSFQDYLVMTTSICFQLKY